MTFNRENNTRPAANSLPEKEILPEGYVDLAENVMHGLKNTQGNGKPPFSITTRQIRKILSLITDILNSERLSSCDTLSDENYQKLQLARVRIAYDAGRDKDVMTFVIKSKLLSYIKGVSKSRSEFIRFAGYLESLVAWHRFMGGEN